MTELKVTWLCEHFKHRVVVFMYLLFYACTFMQPSVGVCVYSRFFLRQVEIPDIATCTKL